MADNASHSCHPTLVEESGLGQEIQPPIISHDQIEQISQNLGNQISKSVKDMKVFSNNEVTSESHDAELLDLGPSLSPQEVNAIREDETPKKRGKRATTKVVGEFSLSYEIPPICIQDNIDLDSWLLCDQSDGSNSNKCQQFSFIQRLQNWTIRLRERTKGSHCDVYYSHMMSETLFRSKKEVVNFMIYEKYPPKPTNKKKEKKKKKQQQQPEAMAEASIAATSNNNESLVGEKKQKCDGEIGQLATDRERVERFLAESYENLMNRDNKYYK